MYMTHPIRTAESREQVRLWLKAPVKIDERLITAIERHESEAFAGIRCPLCAWQPEASSRWCCEAANSPEPVFQGCGTVWNTFTTRGTCPGCSHQWMWTSCLRCDGWSLHEDWYDQGEDRRASH